MARKAKINVKERFSDGEIDLSMSDLDEVPVKEIAALRKTVSLDLSNNRLTSLPANFSVLTFLTKLDLSRNELTELPEDFGSLSKLKSLDLFKNKLERLPLSFGQLGALKFLDLKDNPLIPTIAKVAGPCVDNKGCQQCARDIVKFYKQLQEEVDSEVEMRKKARQKQLEINQQKKLEEKKKLKKEKQPKASIEKEIAEPSSQSTKKIKKEQKKNRRLRKTKPSSSLVYFLSTFVVLWLLFALRVPPLANLVPKISDFYGFFLEQFPPNCRAYGASFGSSVSLLQDQTRSIAERGFRALYNSQIVQGLLTNVLGLEDDFLSKK